MTNAVIALDDFAPLPEGDRQYPIDFSQENKAIKLAETEAEVTVGLCDPANGAIAASLRLFHRKSLRVVALDPAEFASWLVKSRGKAGLDQDAASDADSRIELDKIANDSPVVNYVNSLIIDAIRTRSSDVHIECFEEGARVRFRIDGALAVVDRFPKERFAAVTIRLKLMANLNIMEKRIPQDGRIMADLSDMKVELRVSFVPIARGESIVLRILGGASAPKELPELGIGPDDLRAIEELLAYPHGLIVVSGPTGSGKTTTLSSMLRRLSAESMKVISIEDPIEYLIPGACQIQTNEAIGLGFDSLLRRVLRQDPSVIMVGEIRDSDTAELSVRAALTGHLVLSSLHTNDSVSCVSRLRDLGVEPYLIGSVLRAVLAQRLVRRVCKRCAILEPAPKEDRAAAAALGVGLDKAYRATGCAECRGTGYSGRVALFEIFRMDQGLEELVSKEASVGVLRERATAAGMRSLEASALALVRDGVTSLEEVRREVGI